MFCKKSITKVLDSGSEESAIKITVEREVKN